MSKIVLSEQIGRASHELSADGRRLLLARMHRSNLFENVNCQPCIYSHVGLSHFGTKSIADVSSIHKHQILTCSCPLSGGEKLAKAGKAVVCTSNRSSIRSKAYGRSERLVRGANQISHRDPPREDTASGSSPHGIEKRLSLLHGNARHLHRNCFEAQSVCCVSPPLCPCLQNGYNIRACVCWYGSRRQHHMHCSFTICSIQRKYYACPLH
jgi:hypothetical protein